MRQHSIEDSHKQLCFMNNYMKESTETQLPEKLNTC